MLVTSYAAGGFDGEVVGVEVDIRGGIPGVDIVGLPDGAVKEARERVRVAVRNSGFKFPADRILINLAPAGVRKEGASFDLPIAIALLHAAGQVADGVGGKVMILGELELSGRVRAVNGVLSAVASGQRERVGRFLVPTENLREASALGGSSVYGIGSLKEAVELLALLARGGAPQRRALPALAAGEPLLEGDFADIRGQPFLKRALEVAAAGMHHVLLFGPPGSGKTMAARRFLSILPDLSRCDAIAATRIHSLAGTLPPHAGLLVRPPFRMPHHSASKEGLIGGGKNFRPGEVSLAHRGVLFLDEAPEFKKSLLQSLREPIEEGRVDIARAGASLWFPADFQLLLAANPCPCGNLGRDAGVCLCNPLEIHRYWKRLGGALLDRIDIRIPVRPVDPERILEAGEESSAAIRRRVERAIARQEHRFTGKSFSRNSRIPPGCLAAYCSLHLEARRAFAEAIKKLSLSSRACHSVLKVARTIADLSESETIDTVHLLEAIQHRRFGDGDFYWS